MEKTFLKLQNGKIQYVSLGHWFELQDRFLEGIEKNKKEMAKSLQNHFKNQLNLLATLQNCYKIIRNMEET